MLQIRRPSRVPSPPYPVGFVFTYGTTFGLRPRFVGGGCLAVEVDVASVVDAASVPFATRPAAARPFLILLASYLMAFCIGGSSSILSCLAVVNDVALMTSSTMNCSINMLT